MILFLPSILAFATALAVAWLLTPSLRLVALRFGFVDRPDPRRAGPLKPRLGGVAMFVGFAAAILLTAPLVESRAAQEVGKLIGLLLGGLVVLAVGAIDDRFELGPLPQLGGQVGAAAIAVSAGLTVELINNPFGGILDWSSFPLLVVGLTILWYVGTINTVNFVDGLDGLAAGLIAISAGILFLRTVFLPEGPQDTIAILPLALAGATLGFLRHNTHPASITMGTAGSSFLGFAIASLATIGGTKAATTLLVLAIPFLDVAWIVVWRVWRGHSPFRGDRTHLHYRLLELGLSERQIVLLLYLLCGSFGMLALLLPTRLLKLYAFGGAGLVLAVLLVLLALRPTRRPTTNLPPVG